MDDNNFEVCTEEWEALHCKKPQGEKFWGFYLHIGNAKRIFTFNMDYPQAKRMAEGFAKSLKAKSVSLMPTK